MKQIGGFMKHIYRVHFVAIAGHRTYYDLKTRKTAMKYYGNKIGFNGWKATRIEVLNRSTMQPVSYQDLMKS